MTVRLVDPPAPTPPPPCELLYEFLRGHTRIRCELVDRGRYGIEVRILHDEETLVTHTFAPWHTAPFVTPRAAAIHWAEEERKALERQTKDASR